LKPLINAAGDLGQHVGPYTLWCNIGGGGGNFQVSKVKQLIAKWTGTQKRLFSVFLAHWWDFRNAGTFSQGIFYT